MKDAIKSNIKGLKLTRQRLAILDFLEGNTDHPSAEEIYIAIKKQYRAISFATVYNTLDRLKKRGDIAELTIDPSRKHYDPDTRTHHHIFCTGCGKIADIFDKKININTSASDFADFSISSYQINFKGLCRKCKP